MRTVICGLTMVNWKGVFYRTLELHPQVTALEGPNGAGKTTMMIAAYVVLLPEEKRLTFTPLGETDRAGEKGIWGRLGDGPCYAALDARYGRGERLLAVVHLERGSSSSQKVDLTTVLVRDLPLESDLQALFLKREDYAEGPRDTVRTLPELKEQTRVLGGAATTCETLKQYYQALFDAGLHSLDLESEEARTKLNELLKTSMVGGLSRHLDRGLRDFLLRPDPRLGSTVRTMRGALDDCRATRREVRDALELQQELQDVLEAGQRFFTASVGAIRQRAVERGQLADDKRAAWKVAETSRMESEEKRRQAQSRHAELHQAYERRNLELDAAKTDLDRLREAHRLAQKLEGALATLESRQEAHASKEEELHDAQESHQRARELADQLLEAHSQAVQGLGEAQAGLDTLQRQAARHKWVSSQWQAAIAAWGEDEVLEKRLDFRTRAAALAAETTSRLNASRATAASEGEHRSAFRSLLSKAVTLLGEPIPEVEALDRVDGLLAAAESKRALVERLPQLREDAKRAQKRATEQGEARKLAQELSTLDLPLTTSMAVREATSRTQAALTAAQAREQEQLRRKERENLLAAQKRQEVGARRELLKRWHTAHQQASELSATWQVALDNRTALDLLDTTLGEQEREVLDGLAENKRTRTRLTEEKLRLQSGQAEIDPRLLGARAELNARLLAERFEDVDLAKAAEVEALLGPRTAGLLVEDIQRAARELDRMDDGPEEAWLFVGADTPWSQDQLPSGFRLARSVLVELEGGARWARIPENARLGAASRHRRLEEVEQQLEQLQEEASKHQQRRAQLVSGKAALRRLLPLGELLERPDPEPDLRKLEDELNKHTAAAAEAENVSRAAAMEVTRHSMRLGRLQDLGRSEGLLDEGDLSAEAQQLQRDLQKASGEQAWLSSHQGTLAALHKGRLTLSRVPLSETALNSVRAETDQLQNNLARLQAVLRCLDDVLADQAALAFAEAETRLISSTSVFETLQAAARQAQAAWEGAAQEREQLSRAEAMARSELGAAAGALAAAQDAVSELREELDSLGIGTPTAEDIATAEEKQRQLRREAGELSQQERLAAQQVAVLEAEVGQAAEREQAALSEAEGARVPAERARQRWQAIQAACEEQGLLRDARLEEIEGRAEIALTTEKAGHVKSLHKALLRAKEGAALLERLRLDDTEDLDSERFLRQWSDTRDWLLRRLPGHIFQGDDPILGLRALEGRLRRLEEQLREREELLQGSSRRVAVELSQRIKGAKALLRRLNPTLRETGFGSIERIEIHLEHNKVMQGILEALAAPPEGNDLLFGPKAIDEALDDLYNKHGGGRDGQRLLDYRAYIELQVRVQRRGRSSWEEARGARMSTGEAIGVGSAIMMVVLQAWEEDAVNLRARKNVESCRFLFLDEATRLSRENLATLFQLCERLGLQMLIAAPEVQEGSGNRTYHLERAQRPDGTEVVHITGRHYLGQPP
jgi:chromosome partition protein MukB